MVTFMAVAIGFSSILGFIYGVALSSENESERGLKDCVLVGAFILFLMAFWLASRLLAHWFGWWTPGG